MRFTVGQRIAAQSYCRYVGVNPKYWRNHVNSGSPWLSKEIDGAVRRKTKSQMKKFVKFLNVVDCKVPTASIL